jgi:hypothetical protein
MSKQKLIFLYCSPSGEAALNAMMQEHTGPLTTEDRTEVWESFMRAIYKGPDGHVIRVWFDVEYSDTSPEMAFLKRFLAAVPTEDIYFARVGEEPDDVEEIGSYARIRLSEAE